MFEDCGGLAWEMQSEVGGSRLLGCSLRDRDKVMEPMMSWRLDFSSLCWHWGFLGEPVRILPGLRTPCKHLSSTLAWNCLPRGFRLLVLSANVKELTALKEHRGQDSVLWAAGHSFRPVCPFSLPECLWNSWAQNQSV